MATNPNKSATTVTISSGQTTSPAFNLNANVIFGLYLPTIDTGDITFTVSETQGGTYVPLKNAAGTTLPLVAGTGGCYVATDPEAFRGVTWVKIVAATQAADRTIRVVIGKFGLAA